MWAIGTGRTATPEMAAEAHRFLRQVAANFYGPERAAGLRILYGGSVKPDNIKGLMAQVDIDGALGGRRESGRRSVCVDREFLGREFSGSAGNAERSEVGDFVCWWAPACCGLGWSVYFVWSRCTSSFAALLIVVVLLQSGEAADLAGAFGGAGSQTAFGPRGRRDVSFQGDHVVRHHVHADVDGADDALRSGAGKTAGNSVLQQFSKPPEDYCACAASTPAVPGSCDTARSGRKLLLRPTASAAAPSK